jgi:hypothetical protein
MKDKLLRALKAIQSIHVETKLYHIEPQRASIAIQSIHVEQSCFILSQNRSMTDHNPFKRTT